jgi:hypothetical protein
MKRSQINAAIQRAERLFARHGFQLPPWGSWSPGQWREVSPEEAREIVECGLGWDVTDFGKGTFQSTGLLLFTLRNGCSAAGQYTYAEKIMMVGEGQLTPLHFHWQKTEDIIVRGGGKLVVELFQSDAEEEPTNGSVTVHTDGFLRTVEGGESIVLAPGESITLTPKIYHRFYGLSGTGDVMVGEVSAVNDDDTDNRFAEPLGRFPEIDEDEEPHRLLVKDYQAIWGDVR